MPAVVQHLVVFKQLHFRSGYYITSHSRTDLDVCPQQRGSSVTESCKLVATLVSSYQEQLASCNWQAAGQNLAQSGCITICENVENCTSCHASRTAQHGHAALETLVFPQNWKRAEVGT
jgi:hypothetical protein